MGIIQIVVVVLIIIGLLLYVVNTFIPMDPRIKNILGIFIVIVVILWLLSLFVPLGSFSLKPLR